MSNNLIKIQPIAPEDIDIPTAPEDVPPEIAQTISSTIKQNTVQINNNINGVESNYAAICKSRFQQAVGIDSKAEARIALSNINEEDIVSGHILTCAIIEQAFIRAEEADSEPKRATAVFAIHALESSTYYSGSEQERVMERERINTKYTNWKKKQLEEKSDQPCIINSKPLGQDVDLHHETERNQDPTHTLDPNTTGPANRSTHQEHHAKQRKEAAKKLKQEKAKLENVGEGSVITPIEPNR